MLRHAVMQKCKSGRILALAALAVSSQACVFCFAATAMTKQTAMLMMMMMMMMMMTTTAKTQANNKETKPTTTTMLSRTTRTTALLLSIFNSLKNLILNIEWIMSLHTVVSTFVLLRIAVVKQVTEHKNCKR